jgi:tRNA G18 (ribose-2'-O)-methylase SpoU
VAELRLQTISDFAAPELQPYATMRRPQSHEALGIFIAEGTKVTKRLLQSSFAVVSAVLPERWVEEFTPLLRARPEPVIPVYLANKETLEQLVGFSMYQGVMAVGRIPQPETLDAVLTRAASPRLLVAVDELNNAENLGTLVRNCVGLGAQALLVGETSCSPYLRRSVRSSMGTIFQLPVANTSHLAQTLAELRRLGIRSIAAHPHTDDASLARTDLTGDVCLVFGSEGTGIRPAVLAACDAAVAIPMPPTVDSLNVGSAAAIFLYEAARQRGRM